MFNIIVAAALAFAISISVGAIATAQEAPKASGTYTDALRQCGAEWKASEQRKSVAKGQGMAAWQTFRAECVKRVGYTSKRRGAVGGVADTAKPNS